MVIRQRYF